MEKPLFSFIGTAIRNDLYLDCYNSLKQNSNVPFELIFAGDNPPITIMPDNFVYINTKVKPAQCIEIAARRARGEFLVEFVDDLRCSENFLDLLDYYVNVFDYNKTFISFRYSSGGIIRDNYLRFDMDKHYSPFMGLSICLHKKIWEECGGIDNRFVGAFAVLDLTMRCYERGMSVFLTPDCILTEIEKQLVTRLYNKSAVDGRNLLNSFWMKSDNTISNKRLLPVQRFDDENILIKSQYINSCNRGNETFVWE